MISTKVLKLNIDNNKLVLMSLGVLLVSLFVLYSYFVNLSVLNVVERNNIEESIALTESKVSELESEYFTLIGDINMQNVLAYGLSEPENIKYAQRKSTEKKVVTLNDIR